jgi:DNA-binding SARP family transcriptional activator/tetratricopeptide (TPR) repeat protein
MRFAVLGPLEVYRDDRPLPVGGPQQRTLLAVLLLSAGQVVSTDRLTDCLWAERPPPAARTLLHGCVAQLRRVLAAPDWQPLATRPPGYLLRVRPGELDVHRLDELEEVAARSLADESRTGMERAAEVLSDALALWRGPVLQELDLGPMATEAARLEERRLTVLERRVDVDLRLGRQRPLVGELRAQVGAHPLRERLWAQLMLALYGDHRQADALAAYREVRALLVDQLGIEPGRTLRQLERGVLTGADPVDLVRDHVGPPAPVGARSEPAPGSRPAPARPPVPATPRPPVPAELPAAVASFTGRADQLRWLDRLLPGAGPAGFDGVALAVIAGSPGVGKTALAVHWGHRVRDRFPDGQLYVDLRGCSADPAVRPVQALGGLLQALGVPAEQVPTDLGRAAGMYRTLLAGRRVLVLLDDAGSAEQVRPLLPGGSGCLVLVTSRDRLAGLVARDGASHLGVDVLTSEEATALLARVLGPDRARAERSATARLAAMCGRLPLALQIAAANLALRPERTVARQVAELGGGSRLAELRVERDERTAVAAAFDLSYHALDADTRRTFRLLGQLPGPDATAPAVAACTDRTAGQAAAALDRLTGAHLLTEVTAGRYALHDLLRLYAADRCRQEDAAADRSAATGRLLAWYLGTADAAAALLYPSMLRLPRTGPPAGPAPARFDDHIGALAWLDAERRTLVTAARHAAEHGPYEIAWGLADALRGYFWLHVHAMDWELVARAGLAAAQAGRDLGAEAVAELSLADRDLLLSRHPRAIRHYTRALGLAERTGWEEGQAAILGNLGSAYWKAGRLPEAASSFRRGLALGRRLGPPTRNGVNLGNLGALCAELGQLEDAAQHCTEALALLREAGSRASEAIAHASLGEIDHLRGRLGPARTALTRALALHREVGDSYNEAGTLRVLALVHRDEGRTGPALDLALRSVAVAEGIGDHRVEADALNALASIHDRLGEHEQAVAGYQRVLRLSGEGKVPGAEIEATLGLALARQHLGDPDQAGTLARHAAVQAGSRGYRVLEGRALTALAGIDLDRGRPDRAVDQARRALDLHRTTGHRIGRVRALLVRGRALARAGELVRARADWQDALTLATELGVPEAAEARCLLAPSERPVPAASR